MKRVLTAALAGAFVLAACSDSVTDPVAFGPDGAAFSHAGSGTISSSNSFEQCTTGNPRNPLCGWTSGVLNATHNIYFEGDVVPFRLVIEDLTSNSSGNELVFYYQSSKGNQRSYDYLSGPFATLGEAPPGMVDLCADIGGGKAGIYSGVCSGGNITLPLGSTVPYSGYGGATAGFINDFGGQDEMLIWGGDITSVQILQNAQTAGDGSRYDRVTVTFDAGATSKVLISWGAHLALTAQWTGVEGFVSGSAGISGAPFHVYMDQLNGHSQGGKAVNIMGSVVVLPGHLSGFKFHDLNADGIWDQGDPNDPQPTDEPGLSSWTIRAYQNGVLVDETTTNGAGFWSMELMPGTYTICEVLEEDWSQSHPVASANCGAIHTDLGATGHSVTVVSEGTYANLNFGNYQDGSLSGTKWHDLNADGVRQMGEGGLLGWTIRAFSNGTEVESTTTDANGDWSMDLAPGTYTICEQLQTDWFQSYPGAAGADCSALGSTPGPRGHSVTVVSGGNHTGIDFGNYTTGQVTARKYEDRNADGTRNVQGEDGWVLDTEPWLPGWTIRAVRAGHTTVSGVTDANGEVTLSGLAPGTWTIQEDCTNAPAPPHGPWVQTEPAPTNGCGSGTYQVIVTSQGDHGPYDFGNHSPTPFGGCTAGYWAQGGVRSGAWNLTGLTQTTLVGDPDAFSPFPANGHDGWPFAAYLSESTLLQALEGYPDDGGPRNTLDGAAEILLRQGTAGLLNALASESHSELSYQYTATQVRTMVLEALLEDRSDMLSVATELDLANNAAGEGCPLTARPNSY